MTRYGEHINARATEQSSQARADQVKNNAGGYVFALDKWKMLDRFLILGAEGGTYYVSEKKLTKDNAKSLQACIDEDGPRVVARIVEISDAGRAPKNDPAIFALAMCAGAKDERTRKLALAALPKVCRIGTHLFHFAADVKNFRGWGPSLTKAIARWYTDREADNLAYDLIKYQQRDGWGHRDLIRLSHPKAPTPAHRAALVWSTRGTSEDAAMAALTKVKGGGTRGTPAPKSEMPKIISAFELLHLGVRTTSFDLARAAQLIRDYRLPHECVPNEIKDRAIIWEALLEHMPMTAMIRNLAKLTEVGLFCPMGEHTARVVNRLTDPGLLKKARVHPISVLLAMRTYAMGHGLKGSLRWNPVREIIDALDTAFYASFDAVVPTNKKTFLALDVSGSMGDCIANTSLSCRDASAAMAMVTARSEPHWYCAGFASGGTGYGGRWGGSPSQLVQLNISPRQRLGDIVNAIQRIPMGGTDCALPMVAAREQKLEVDTFVVYTDNETWAGTIHPFQALRRYREKMGRAVKLIVVGMTATDFTIADPSDAGMLDVAGFDAASPAVISDFSMDKSGELR